MSEEIIVALITGGLAFLGVVITNVTSQRKIDEKFRINQAVMSTELNNLKSEVEKHNQVIERTFILEGQMKEAQHDIKEIKEALR